MAKTFLCPCFFARLESLRPSIRYIPKYPSRAADFYLMGSIVIFDNIGFLYP